jgi:hypothetical protein
VADPGPVADREDETPMPACEAATAWPKQELASRIGISRNCLAKILDLKCENLSPRISQKIGSAIAALNMHSLGEETQNAILLELARAETAGRELFCRALSFAAAFVIFKIRIP